jgi:hypothetical protein
LRLQQFPDQRLPDRHITGYRIDRNAPSEFARNWVADDFQFEIRAVPVPGTLALAGIGLLAFVGARRTRT